MKIKNKIKEIISPLVGRLIPGNFDQNKNDRSGALYRAWGHVINSRMSGGYYEFGVYHGESFRESYRLYQKYITWIQSEKTSPEKWRRKIQWPEYHHFYGFDTFSGMPDNSENNKGFEKGSFLSSLSNVKKLGDSIGMKSKKENVKYFKGTFSEISLSKKTELSQLKPAVIVNIDSDLYTSAKDALNIIQPKLQQGTILLMDDWNCFCADNQQGERRALSEFLKENPQYYIEDYFSYSYAGKAFIVHIK